jgi:DnaK suppressor protein
MIARTAGNSRTGHFAKEWKRINHMATAARAPQDKLIQVERLLASKRQEIATRLDQHRSGVLIEREPDDEGAEAHHNYSREFALTTLERERRTLSEIEQALARVKKGEYGTCPLCGKRLPEARLRAIPWAKLCVPCAEGGGNSAHKSD